MSSTLSQSLLPLSNLLAGFVSDAGRQTRVVFGKAHRIRILEQASAGSPSIVDEHVEMMLERDSD